MPGAKRSSKRTKPGPEPTACRWCHLTTCKHCQCPSYRKCTHAPGEPCAKERYGRRRVCNTCERRKLLHSQNGKSKRKRSNTNSQRGLKNRSRKYSKTANNIGSNFNSDGRHRLNRNIGNEHLLNKYHPGLNSSSGIVQLRGSNSLAPVMDGLPGGDSMLGTRGNMNGINSLTEVITNRGNVLKPMKSVPTLVPGVGSKAMMRSITEADALLRQNGTNCFPSTEGILPQPTLGRMSSFEGILSQPSLGRASSLEGFLSRENSFLSSGCGSTSKPRGTPGTGEVLMMRQNSLLPSGTSALSGTEAITTARTSFTRGGSLSGGLIGGGDVTNPSMFASPTSLPRRSSSPMLASTSSINSINSVIFDNVNNVNGPDENLQRSKSLRFEDSCAKDIGNVSDLWHFFKGNSTPSSLGMQMISTGDLNTGSISTYSASSPSSTEKITSFDSSFSRKMLSPIISRKDDDLSQDTLRRSQLDRQLSLDQQCKKITFEKSVTTSVDKPASKDQTVASIEQSMSPVTSEGEWREATDPKSERTVTNTKFYEKDEKNSSFLSFATNENFEDKKSKTCFDTSRNFFESQEIRDNPNPNEKNGSIKNNDKFKCKFNPTALKDVTYQKNGVENGNVNPNTATLKKQIRKQNLKMEPENAKNNVCQDLLEIEKENTVVVV